MGKLVNIIGNSGSGKTTLTQRLAETGLFQVHLETHVDRPFQAAFMRDPRYGLANQMDYLLLCAEQEQQIRAQEGVFIQDGGLDQDFYVYTVLFHRHGYLDKDEFALCERLYHTLRRYMPPPEVIIQLTAPLEVAAQRKASRGRALDISTLNDLEAMNELLPDLRRGLMESAAPPCWIEIDSSQEDESYRGCLPGLIDVLRS